MDGDYIIFHLYTGKYNKEHPLGNPEETIAGRIENNLRILTKGSEGEEQELFTYTGESLHVLGYENSVAIYTSCQ